MTNEEKFEEVVPSNVDFMSPYALAKVAKFIWGIDVTPQSIYSAVRQGRLESFRGENDEILVSRETAKAYVANQKMSKKTNWLSALK